MGMSSKLYFTLSTVICLTTLLECVNGLTSFSNSTDVDFYTVENTTERRLGTTGTPLCYVSGPEKYINIFFWTESEAKDPAFFTKLWAFMNYNCANARVVRLVLRMAVPESRWMPTTASPLYTEFLAKVQKAGMSIQMVLFPYFMESASRKAWLTYSGLSDPVESAVMLMFKWNKFLSGLGVTSRFKGIVIDLEESKYWTGSYPMAVNAAVVSRCKNNWGAFEFGLTIGWDDTKRFSSMPYIDKFYMQMYDLYDSAGSMARNTRSPFYIYRDNPAALVDYFVNKLMKPFLPAYQAYSSKMIAMWSTQSNTANCFFPKPGLGICDGNWEFGLWTGGRFNQFIRYLQDAHPAFAAVPHGIYHFATTPKIWMGP